MSDIRRALPARIDRGGPTLPGRYRAARAPRPPRRAGAAARPRGPTPPRRPSVPPPPRARRWSARSRPATGAAAGPCPAPSPPDRSNRAAPQLVLGPGEGHVEQAALLVQRRWVRADAIGTRPSHIPTTNTAGHCRPLARWNVVSTTRSRSSGSSRLVPGSLVLVARVPATRPRPADRMPGPGRHPRSGSDVGSAMAACTLASCALVRVRPRCSTSAVRAWAHLRPGRHPGRLVVLGGVHDHLRHRPVGARGAAWAPRAPAAAGDRPARRWRPPPPGGAAVVLVEAHHPGAPQDLGQAVEQRRGRPRSTVDRLVGVADHEEVGVVGQHGRQQAELGRVHVLHLVDEEVARQRQRMASANPTVAGQGVGAGDEQVVEVEAAAGAPAPPRSGRRRRPPGRH